MDAQQCPVCGLVFHVPEAGEVWIDAGGYEVTVELVPTPARWGRGSVKSKVVQPMPSPTAGPPQDGGEPKKVTSLRPWGMAIRWDHLHVCPYLRRRRS